LTELEGKVASDLDEARSRLSCRLSEVAIGQVDINVRQVGVIEDVEEVEP
jgi:hypothetical protein